MNIHTPGQLSENADVSSENFTSGTQEQVVEVLDMEQKKMAILSDIAQNGTALSSEKEYDALKKYLQP